MTKTFELNKDGKIELTKEELKKLLDEVYEEGRNGVYVYTTPYTPTYSPWTITTSANTVTLSDKSNYFSNVENI